VAALWDVFSLTTTAHDILSRSLLLGIMLGIVLSQVINFILSSIRSERQTDASGIYNTTRQLGSFLGTAIIGIVLALGFVHRCCFSVKHRPSLPAKFCCQSGSAMQWSSRGWNVAFVAMILGWSSACLLQAYSSGRRGRLCEEVNGEDEKT